MVLVRRPMPGITMEQLLLPVLPSIKKTASFTCKQSQLIHLQEVCGPALLVSGLQEAQKGGK